MVQYDYKASTVFKYLSRFVEESPDALASHGVDMGLSMIMDMGLSEFVDKSWSWTWDGYKTPPPAVVLDAFRGVSMVMDETELMARGWYWVKIKSTESNSYTITALANVLNSDKYTPMDVFRALTILWTRIEDIYLVESTRLFEYWANHSFIATNTPMASNLGLPEGMAQLMGMGQAISMPLIDTWDKFTCQDRELFAAINSVVSKGEYWVWCPNSTTTLSLSSSVSGVLAGPKSQFSVKLGIPFADSHKFKANVLIAYQGLNTGIMDLLPAVETSTLTQGAQGVRESMMNIMKQHLVPAMLTTHSQSHQIVHDGPIATRITGQELVPRQGVGEIRDEHPSQREANACCASHRQHEPPTFTQRTSQRPGTQEPHTWETTWTKTLCCICHQHPLQESSSTTQWQTNFQCR